MLYRIRFSPYTSYDDNEFSLSCHRVYSIDKNMILLFMKQHNFDPQQTLIETLPSNYEDDDLESHTLDWFTAYSNKDHQYHKIVTTRTYVIEAVEEVVKCLSDYLIFGETIFRRDIPFIELVNQYLDEIPYIFAFDYDIIDGCPSCDTSYFNVKKDLEQFSRAIDEEYDTSSIDDLYNRFMFKIVPGKPLPITLEAYVRCFVKLVITNKLGVS